LAKTHGRNTPKTHFPRPAPEVGHQAPTSTELTLGARLLAPGAQTGKSPCVEIFTHMLRLEIYLLMYL